MAASREREAASAYLFRTRHVSVGKQFLSYQSLALSRGNDCRDAENGKILRVLVPIERLR